MPTKHISQPKVSPHLNESGVNVKEHTPWYGIQ